MHRISRRGWAKAWTPFLPKHAVVMLPRSLAAQPAPNPAPPIDGTVHLERESPAQTETDSLDQIAQSLDGCTRCKLCHARKTVVIGEGNPRAKLVFVGEGPGEQEDLQGRPFVGKAGQLLDRMIEAMGLKRSEVFILNVVKCRPPGNRNPEPDEIDACSPFLMRQLKCLKPQIIVALGKFAAQTLLQTQTRITLLRGNFHDFHGMKLMPTFHPAFLLRNPASKKEAWLDLQMVARELGLQIPKRN